jgi:DNA-binding protein H-NS
MQAYSFVPSKKAAQVAPPVKTSDPASTSAIVQTTPTPNARKVVEAPLSVAKAVEKAGIRASEEDIQKIKELIARLKTATGEDRVRALKDVKNIACITKQMPTEQSIWPGQLGREPRLIKLEKSSFSKSGVQQPRHDNQKGGYGRGSGAYNQFNN